VLGGRLYAIGGKDRGFFRDVFVTTPAQDGSLAGWQSTAGTTRRGRIGPCRRWTA